MGMSRRIRAVQGGTSASKTVSILLYLIHRAQSDDAPTITSVVAESVPHLKRGAIRDFKNIMEAQGYWRESNWNATDSIYTFETKSSLEFFSTDNGDKLRGARRDRCFMNEANNNNFDAFEQLEVRTKEFFFIDWNPSNEYWFYTELLGKRDDVEHLILTYRDNEALSPEIVKSIEQRRNRKGWWKVYGEGQLGEVEGKIYKDWQIIDELPFEAKLLRRGLDFGYSNDPAAIVAIYQHNGGYILDEEVYETGLNNARLADRLNSNEYRCLVIADGSEPKSIDEIKLAGVEIIAANKGPGSVNQGINFMQAQKISVTKRSVNLIGEYRNYLWETDKDGKILTTPVDEYNHALDAARYGFNGKVTSELAQVAQNRPNLARYGQRPRAR